MSQEPSVRFDLAGTMTNSWDEVLVAARCVERVGFHGFHASDHLLPVAGADPGADFLEAWSCVSALAACTERIRLGVMVSGNTYRHPVMLAKIVTTIDHISRGRVELGIGTSWSEADHVAYGIPFPRFPQRVEALGEALEVIRALWTSPRSDYRGDYYQLVDAPFSPAPVQVPHPPVMVAGSSDRVLALTARYADAWNAVGTPAYLMERGDALDRACHEAGRDPQQVRRSVWLQFRPTRSAEEAEGAISERARYLASAPRASDPSLRCAVPGETPEQIARGGVLAGTPEDIASQVRGWVDAGVRHLVMSTPRPFDTELFESVAERLLAEFG
ncbi:TIGR03560 family F420-dependent LLM class oxidoreductase [Myxococcota bacterium]|nr:TIGR03560 family F420-dependent LLM class oxidoreductase [Myxococcota bacterium]